MSVNATATFSGSSAVRLRLVAQQTSATQTTVTVNYTLSIERPSGSGFFAAGGSGNSWQITTGTPTNGSGSNFTYDFRGTNPTRSFQIASINRTINVSGPETRQIGASASQPQAGGIGSASISSQTLTLTPLAPPPTPPSWTTTSFSEIARVGSSVLFQVSANNTTSYALASGSLPPGLSLNSSGFITGTTSAGASQAFNFVVSATGSGGTVNSNTFTINRRQPLPIWSDNTLNTTNLRVGTAFADSVSATNATSYTVNGLPAGGLTFSGGTTSATVSGTPTSTSSFSFTINALNADSDSISESFTFTPRPRLPVFTDSTLATTIVRINQNYLDGVTATNASSYAIHSGALPPGVELSTIDGAIFGAPTAVGTYVFVARATNSINESVFTGSLSLTVQPAGSGKVWNGATWVQAPFRVWNGAAWVEAPVKIWNGAAWVDPTS